MKFRTIVVVALLLIGMATVASAQWLTQDKADYAPGETVTLTGSGFASGEDVLLQVHHLEADPDSADSDHEPWTVAADANGGFVTTWLVCAVECIGQTLLATADGVTSGYHAETAFTDSGPLSNTPRPEIPVAEGNVRAFLELGNTIYIGGNFLSVGPYTGSGVPIDPVTGVPVSGFPKVNGTVRAVAADGSGGWFIGGNFTNVGGVARNRVAHIDAANTVTAWNPNANNEVRAISVSGSVVFVAGLFNGTGSIGGQTRNRIAALDATTGLATPWNPNASGGVNALAVSGSTVYAGGSFSVIGGQTRNAIAALSATTGLATTWNPNANNAVNTLAVSGSTVYAGGSFGAIGGQTRNRIAALDATTGLATSWNPNANNVVNTLLPSGGVVYAGGDFVFIGGQTRNAIAALDATTGLATSWNPNANFQVRTLAAAGSTVYAGGDFASIGGQTRMRLAALDATTGLATSWNPSANASVNALAVAGSTVYAGGSFSSVNIVRRHRLAAFDATTGAILAWDPSANAEVWSLAVNPSGSTIYVSGAFSSSIPGSGGISIGGQARNMIAAVDATTGLATSWNPGAGGLVRTVALSGDGNTVYIGGDFAIVAGQLRLNAAALNATTGLTTSWNPNADNFVQTLVVSGSTVYAGGAFTTIGGQTRSRIAALNGTTGLATTWNPNANNRVDALLVSGSTIYAGGWFSNIGGQARNAIAALDIATGLATSWNPNANFQVFTLATNGSMVYAGGSFTNVGGQVRPRIAEIDVATGVPTSWNPSAGHEVHKVIASPNTVYVGGLFASIGGEGRTNLAAFAPTVICSPPVTSSPVSESVCVGASVTFSVAATGTAPLGYQWRKGGVDIAGATGSSYTIPSVFTADAGSYVVVVSNACGSATSNAATLTVSAPAVISFCPPDVAVECGGSTSPAQTGSATASGTGVAVFSADVFVAGCGNTGVITRTWTATGTCGSASCVQTISIVDTTAPSISQLPAPSTIQCPGTPVFTTPTADDACGSVTLASTDSTTGGGASYSVTRTWTATDACGNVSTASQTIHVADTTAPVVTCPGDTTVACTAAGGAVVNFSVSAADACDPNPTVASEPASGTLFAVGEHVVTVVATDAAGNESECTFQITVEAGTGTLAGRVTASCPESPTPLLGVRVDAYAVGNGTLVDGAATDVDGNYVIPGLPSGSYVVTVLTPLGYTTASDELPGAVLCGDTTTVDFGLDCLDIEPEQRTIGFWKHQVGVATGGKGAAQVDAASLCAYLDLIELHFNSNTMNAVEVYEAPASGSCPDKLLVARHLLNLKGNVAMVSRAKQQLMALLLNVASQRLALSHSISADGRTVSQAITYCDNLIDAPNGDHELAKSIADAINNGIPVGAGLIPNSTPDIAYKETEVPKPARFALEQSRPNPFNPSTTIAFTLPQRSSYRLTIVDPAGRTVRRFVGEAEGVVYVQWNGTDQSGRALGSGLYFYRLQAGAFDVTKKMLMLK